MGDLRVYIREVHPGREPGHTLPHAPATPCTRATAGTDPKNRMTLDHLTPRADGRLYAYDFEDEELWPEPFVTLAECKIGDLVFANVSNWPGDKPAWWNLYEVMPPPAS